MQLVVNTVASTVADDITVADVVRALAGADARGIAVAVNGDVVPRFRWADTHPSEGDQIEILTAVQGG